MPVKFNGCCCKDQIGFLNKLVRITLLRSLCTAIKHPVPDQVKPSFVIFDIRAL